MKVHALEENDNGAMDFVCDLLATLAIEYDIAIDAPHHNSEGAADARRRRLRPWRQRGQGRRPADLYAEYYEPG